MSSAKELQLLAAIASEQKTKNVFNIVLIGPNQRIEADEYTASAALSLNDSDGVAVKGKVTTITLVSHVEVGGTGLVNEPVGHLHFFKADPSVAARAAALSANGADHLEIIGSVFLKSADWISDASGAVASILIDIPFEDLTEIFCVFHNDLGSAGFNTVAAEDETLKFSIGFTTGRS